MDKRLNRAVYLFASILVSASVVGCAARTDHDPPPDDTGAASTTASLTWGLCPAGTEQVNERVKCGERDEEWIYYRNIDCEDRARREGCTAYGMEATVGDPNVCFYGTTHVCCMECPTDPYPEPTVESCHETGCPSSDQFCNSEGNCESVSSGVSYPEEDDPEPPPPSPSDFSCVVRGCPPGYRCDWSTGGCREETCRDTGCPAGYDCNWLGDCERVESTITYGGGYEGDGCFGDWDCQWYLSCISGTCC